MDLLKECAGASRIGISGHIRPDGDCVGSCLALYQYLKNQMPEASVEVFLLDPPTTFSEMKGFDEIKEPGAEREPFDVFFALDTVKERMGESEQYFDQAKKTINIDHHVTNKGQGTVSVVRPEIGSTCEVLYDLFEKSGMDAEIAKSIYIGMIHDTGIFQYSNTSPATMRKAADLMEYGFNFPSIIEETYYQKTYLQTQIMGRAMMESIRFMDGKCVVSSIDRKMMEFYGVTSKDFEGIVNQLRNIKGVECAIFMYEIANQEFKVSLRTTPMVDASKVVSHFGGGGHARAAGCNMVGNFHDCVNNLSFYIEQELLENSRNV